MPFCIRTLPETQSVVVGLNSPIPTLFVSVLGYKSLPFCVQYCVPPHPPNHAIFPRRTTSPLLFSPSICPEFHPRVEKRNPSVQNSGLPTISTVFPGVLVQNQKNHNTLSK